MLEDKTLKSITLTYAETLHLLERLASQDDLVWELAPKKNLIKLTDSHRTKVLDLRLPLVFPELPVLDNDEKFDVVAYLERVSVPAAPYLLVLIQAGYASLGYFEEGKIVHHKAISAYMVRKKQGKAQIKHLNTKGKSRLGSRIRLQNTTWFFEQINRKLKAWNVLDKVTRIGQSGSPDLWHLFYTSKETPPFQKDDRRIRKIPLAVQKPNFAELQRINRWVMRGHVAAHQEDLPFLDNLDDVIEW